MKIKAKVEQIGYTAAGCAVQTARQFRLATAAARNSISNAETEGRKTLAGLQERGKTATQRLEQRIRALARQEVERMGLATSKDIEELAELRDRLARIEEKIAHLS